MRLGFPLLFVVLAAAAVAEPPPPPPPLGEREGLDRTDLQQVDVEPTTGALRYRTVDLTLGDGPRALELNRTYRPWSGSPTGLGVHWASVLDAHLLPLSQGYAFVDGEGVSHVLVPSAEAGVFHAVFGRRSTLTQDPDGFTLRGLGDERRYRFDRAGRLLWLDAAGARHHFRRDAGGLLTGAVVRGVSRGAQHERIQEP